MNAEDTARTFRALHEADGCFVPGVHLSLAELAGAGVKRISVGSGLMRLAYSAMLEAAEKMLDPGSFDFGDRARGFARFNELLGSSASGP